MPSWWEEYVYGGAPDQQAAAQAASQAQNALAQYDGNGALGGANYQGGVNSRYNYVLQQNAFGLPEYVPQAQQAPRPHAYARARDYMESLQDIAVSWLEEGMEFSEIVVPKKTYIKLYERMAAMRRFEPARPVRENERPRMEVLCITTAMGTVRFVCEDDRPSKYNLDKYMETVE